MGYTLTLGNGENKILLVYVPHRINTTAHIVRFSYYTATYSKFLTQRT